MDLKRDERRLINRRVEGAVACIPLADKPDSLTRLTAEQACSELGLDARLQAIYDEERGWTWLVADGKYISNLAAALKSGTLEGYKMQPASKETSEVARLTKLIEADYRGAKQTLPHTNSTPERHLSPPVSSSNQSSHVQPSSPLRRGAFPGSPTTPNLLDWRHHNHQTSDLPDAKSSLEDELELLSNGATSRSPKKKRKLGRSHPIDSTSFAPALLSLPSSSLSALSNPQSFTPSTPTRSTSILTPGPYPPFDNLPTEIIVIIIEECFREAKTVKSHLKMLSTLYCVRGRIGETIKTLAPLWTKVHPALPHHLTEMMFQLSGSSPLSIEYSPKPPERSRDWNRLERILHAAEEKRDNWESIVFTIAPWQLKTAILALNAPAPGLHTLHLSVLGNVKPGDLALIPTSQSADVSFKLLGAVAPRLRHLVLTNISLLFDLASFPELQSLTVADGVRLRCSDLVIFLGKAAKSLRELIITDIHFIDNVEAESGDKVASPIELPQCRHITLQDKKGSGTPGFIKLFYSVRAPECKSLHLYICDVHPFTDNTFAELVTPVIACTIETQNRTSLCFRHLDGTYCTFWKGFATNTPSDGSNNQIVQFDIGLLGDPAIHALHFSSFANRILQQLRLGREEEVEIWLDFGDILSGTIRGRNEFEWVEAEPFLESIFFGPIQQSITTVVAHVVDNHFGCIKKLLAPGTSQGFSNVRKVIIHTIPAAEVHVQPHESFRCYVENLVATVGKAYAPPPLENAEAQVGPAPESSFEIKLNGLFSVPDAVILGLLEGRSKLEWAGISIDFEGARLSLRI